MGKESVRVVYLIQASMSVLPKDLSPPYLVRCAELLEIIVRPGDHSFGEAIQEAQTIFGYSIKPELKLQRKRVHRKPTYYDIRGTK